MFYCPLILSQHFFLQSSPQSFSAPTLPRVLGQFALQIMSLGALLITLLPPAADEWKSRRERKGCLYWRYFWGVKNISSLFQKEKIKGDGQKSFMLKQARPPLWEIPECPRDQPDVRFWWMAQPQAGWWLCRTNPVINVLIVKAAQQTWICPLTSVTSPLSDLWLCFKQQQTDI